LRIGEALRLEVIARLEDDWSAADLPLLKEEYPGRPERQVSDETIYLSHNVQGRGALRNELTKHLRRRQQIRQPRKRDATNRGKIKDWS
jgi:hypothetical protein